MGKTSALDLDRDQLIAAVDMHADNVYPSHKLNSFGADPSRARSTSTELPTTAPDVLPNEIPDKPKNARDLKK